MQFVVDGLGYTLDFNYDFSGVWTTVDPVNGRRRQWLRRNTCRRSSDKTGSVEYRWIIVRRGLDIVSEERVLLDHEFTLFVFRADGLLAAICRVRNQNRERVDTGLEGRDIDGWSRERRITFH